MGLSRTPAHLAAKLNSCAAGLATVPASGTLEACKLVKASVLVSYAGAGAQGGHLRNVGKRGSKIGVSSRVTTAGAAATGVVAATGPVQLIENPTRPHRIPKARKGRGGRQKVIVIPGVGPKAHANHPGTRGKKPWAKGVRASLPLIPRAYEHGVIAQMARVF